MSMIYERLSFFFGLLFGAAEFRAEFTDALFILFTTDGAIPDEAL